MLRPRLRPRCLHHELCPQQGSIDHRAPEYDFGHQSEHGLFGVTHTQASATCTAFTGFRSWACLCVGVLMQVSLWTTTNGATPAVEPLSLAPPLNARLPLLARVVMLQHHHRGSKPPRAVVPLLSMLCMLHTCSNLASLQTYLKSRVLLPT